MAGILVSPDLQIRKRCAMYKNRNESPKFRDILRARCHARIKASRRALIEKFRDLKDEKSTGELHDTLSNFIREEADVLITKTAEFPTPDEAFYEPLESEEEWLIEEYEKILSEEEAAMGDSWESQVICPLCQMSVLGLSGSGDGGQLVPVCPKCQLSLPPVESVEELRRRLDFALQLHSSQTSCSSPAYFALVDSPELRGLCLICEECMHFSQVI